MCKVLEYSIPTETFKSKISKRKILSSTVNLAIAVSDEKAYIRKQSLYAKKFRDYPDQQQCKVKKLAKQLNFP